MMGCRERNVRQVQLARGSSEYLEPVLNAQAATSLLFDDIFSECFLQQIVLIVQLDGGCAARFSMNRSDPESIARVPDPPRVAAE